MKGKILASILTLFILVSFTQPSIAEMPKEGTGSATMMYSGTFKMFSPDENHQIVTYENTGVLVSDNGKGPFNNMSTHNVGTIYFENGVGKLLGYVTCTDPDGDKVVIEIKETNAKPAPAPDGNSGTGKYLYGTGKFAGITGTTQYKRWYFYPAIKDTYQAISKSKSSWKIP